MYTSAETVDGHGLALGEADLAALSSRRLRRRVWRGGALLALHVHGRQVLAGQRRHQDTS